MARIWTLRIVLLVNLAILDFVTGGAEITRRGPASPP